MLYRRLLVIFLLLGALSACGPTLAVTVQSLPPATPTPETGQPAPPTRANEQGACEYAQPLQCATESLLSTTVTYLTFFAELCGAFVIGVAVIRSLLRFIPHVIGRQPPDEPYTEYIRLQLGKSLALALEFELGADILKTAVAPTLSIIAQLAAIALLRTFLNYFLEQELRQAEQRHAGLHLAAAGQPATGPDQERPQRPDG
jgi:uncharacterized membrane protein